MLRVGPLARPPGLALRLPLPLAVGPLARPLTLALPLPLAVAVGPLARPLTLAQGFAPTLPFPIAVGPLARPPALARTLPLAPLPMGRCRGHQRLHERFPLPPCRWAAVAATMATSLGSRPYPGTALRLIGPVRNMSRVDVRPPNGTDGRKPVQLAQVIFDNWPRFSCFGYRSLPKLWIGLVVHEALPLLLCSD
jgi:hypothetical protein